LFTRAGCARTLKSKVGWVVLFTFLFVLTSTCGIEQRKCPTCPVDEVGFDSTILLEVSESVEGSIPTAEPDIPQLELPPLLEEADTPVGVEGRICSPSGNYFVSNVFIEVRYFDENGTERSQGVVTNSEGHFFIPYVPEGQHRFKATRGRFSIAQRIQVEESSEITNLGDICFASDSVRIAVVEGSYDNIESIIEQLGFTTIEFINSRVPTYQEDFLALESLLQYDIVYFNCGANEQHILDWEAAAHNLRDYLSQGGAIYASDWSYDLVENTIPSAINFYGNDTVNNAAQHGRPEVVSGAVHDSPLAKMCGVEVEIKYDLSYWAIAVEANINTDVLVSGTVHSNIFTAEIQQFERAPLMVQIPFGLNGGKIIYTSFHNEAQVTDDMLCILNYIIFSL